MIFYKRLPLILISVLILAFVLSSQVVDNLAYSHKEMEENTARPDLNIRNKDPVLNLLGKSFDEVKQVLGEPDEQGYSRWLGPHYYILFQHGKGDILFSSPVSSPVSSPELLENKIAVSIILGPGQEILGAKTGMHFSEIKEILGEPAYGPELGMDNLYYMDYFFGEMSDQVPEVFISFSAACIDCPTQDVFIKWEAFEYRPGGTIAGGDITKR